MKAAEEVTVFKTLDLMKSFIFMASEIQVDFFSWLSHVHCSVQNEKKSLTSQPEALSDEGFHERSASAGSLAFFPFPY